MVGRLLATLAVKGLMVVVVLVDGCDTIEDDGEVDDADKGGDDDDADDDGDDDDDDDDGNPRNFTYYSIHRSHQVCTAKRI